MKKKKKIYLVSSGTGGHAAPILSLYKELVKLSDVNPLVLHSGSEIERNLFKNTNFIRIISAKYDRNSAFKRFLYIPLITIGVIQSFLLLLFKRPDLIVSKGGYGAVPVLLAANFLQISYFIHESDSHLGLSNKMFSKKAEEVFLGFPKEIYKEDVVHKKYKYIGQIIEILPRVENNKRKVIYFTGGSQGAKSVNRVVYKIVPKLVKDYIIYHQVGDNNLKKARQIKDNIGSDNYKVFGFEYLLAREALSKADLVVARAGANTIGEIAMNNKASILIPYPYAASDHQLKNAKYLEKSGSALIVLEKQLNEKYLLDRINYIMSGNNASVLGDKISKAIKANGLKILVSEIRKKVGV